ncbi:unnamed protein product [Protopolystoma xenopodis]|uniref:Uncharacterized protein n=1 Tax=Protopolystoma xenopodis TaxID=117903 RepID=A0A3S5AXT9_9PLAT|nr:unnamed protein product [Protopolystoma xenopodis]
MFPNVTQLKPVASSQLAARRRFRSKKEAPDINLICTTSASCHSSSTSYLYPTYCTTLTSSSIIPITSMAESMFTCTTSISTSTISATTPNCVTMNNNIANNTIKIPLPIGSSSFNKNSTCANKATKQPDLSSLSSSPPSSAPASFLRPSTSRLISADVNDPANSQQSISKDNPRNFACSSDACSTVTTPIIFASSNSFRSSYLANGTSPISYGHRPAGCISPGSDVPTFRRPVHRLSSIPNFAMPDGFFGSPPIDGSALQIRESVINRPVKRNSVIGIMRIPTCSSNNVDSEASSHALLGPLKYKSDDEAK